ncbi:MAG: hypothetical protein HY966_01665 [Ignavibacteriales bacterium]|nr:hypothetical protein [Ignavibacteriales bacterium]
MNTFIKIFAAALMLCIASVALAQEKKDSVMKETMKSHSMTGYLSDKMCSKRFLGEEGKAKAAKHTKACALEDGCKQSGYGLIFDGKFYKFDAAGDKMAAEYLSGTKKENNLLVEVVGQMDGSQMKVASIKDAVVKMEKKMEKSDKM